MNLVDVVVVVVVVAIAIACAAVCVVVGIFVRAGIGMATTMVVAASKAFFPSVVAVIAAAIDIAVIACRRKERGKRRLVQKSLPFLEIFFVAFLSFVEIVQLLVDVVPHIASFEPRSKPRAVAVFVSVVLVFVRRGGHYVLAFMLLQ